MSAVLKKIPESEREKVTEITMDFSDSKFSIAKQCFPKATIVIDCFHIVQRLCEGLEEMRLKFKRLAVTETKKEAAAFVQNEERKAKQRAYYRKRHPKNKKEHRGRKRIRKQKYRPALLANGETKVEMLTRSRNLLAQSVFNGFQDLVASFFTDIDPELKVTPAKGKTIAADAPELTRLKAYTETLEENALVISGDHQAMVTIKGVDDNFAQATEIGNLLYGDGTFTLHADVLEFGVLGIQLAAQLGLGASFDAPLQVYAPKKGERVNLANPTASFTQSELYSPGVVFAVKQEKYDAHYIITSLRFARQLFGQQGRVSAIELKFKDGTDIRDAQKDIQEILGEGFTVEDRYQQQADVFRIMEVEKLIAYLFLTFILLVACFNIIGSVSMLIIDKKDDVRTLRNLGAKDNQVIRIFLFEGRLISGFGALAGIVLGLLLCYLQQAYGFITLGNSAGSFVVDAYPVSVRLWDVALIFVTVLLVSYGALWYPVRYLAKRLLD